MASGRFTDNSSNRHFLSGKQQENGSITLKPAKQTGKKCRDITDKLNLATPTLVVEPSAFDLALTCGNLSEALTSFLADDADSELAKAIADSAHNLFLEARTHLNMLYPDLPAG